MTRASRDNPRPAAADAWESLALKESDVGSHRRAMTPAPAPADSASAGRSLAPTGLERDLPAEPVPTGGAWTIPMLCAGIALIACCILIPQADVNRRMAYERLKLQGDLDSIRRQVAVNDEFLKKVADDPNLAERLAQRQMKIIREGTRVLELKHPSASADEMSPFHLVTVAPPPPLAPYRPLGGMIASLCYNARSRLYLTGLGLGMIAVGLVLGYAPKS